MLLCAECCRDVQEKQSGAWELRGSRTAELATKLASICRAEEGITFFNGNVRTFSGRGSACCAPANALCAVSPDEDLIRQILADGASGVSHSQDLGLYMRAETDLISGL